jgi:hypothetical protein
MTSERSASTSAVRDAEAGLLPPAAWLAAASSAARTRATTALAKPSSQLRRQARGLLAHSGTGAATRPCHICTSSEV